MAEPSDLKSHVGYWLRQVSNHVSHAFARKLQARGVTVAEWVLMRELYGEGAVTPSLLAERIGLTRGAISKLADRLLAKRLLDRTDSPTDGRTHSLSLTEQGRTLVPELAALADQNDAEFFDHLSEAQRAQLVALMSDIVDRRGLRSVPLD